LHDALPGLALPPCLALPSLKQNKAKQEGEEGERKEEEKKKKKRPRYQTLYVGSQLV